MFIIEKTIPCNEDDILDIHKMKVKAIYFCCSLIVLLIIACTENSSILPEGHVAFLVNDKLTIGNQNSKLVLVQFINYECSSCVKYLKKILPRIKSRYIDTDKVLLIPWLMPSSLNKEAIYKAKSVRCAGDQGRFWQMNNFILANSNPVKMDKEYAESISLDMQKFENCMVDTTIDTLLMKNHEEAEKIGVSKIPSYVIGKLIKGSNGNVVVGALYSGGVTFNNISEAIDVEASR